MRPIWVEQSSRVEYPFPLPPSAMCKNANKPSTKNDLLDAALDSRRERERGSEGGEGEGEAGRGGGDSHELLKLRPD